MDTCGCHTFPALKKLGNTTIYLPAHPEYKGLGARIRSFIPAHENTKKRAHEFAEAGFFFHSSPDKTVCFQCGLGLKEWLDTDDVWIEHAMYSSRCPFVQKKKGREFIASVLGTRPPSLCHDEIIKLATDTKPAI